MVRSAAKNFLTGDFTCPDNDGFLREWQEPGSDASARLDLARGVLHHAYDGMVAAVLARDLSASEDVGCRRGR